MPKKKITRTTKTRSTRTTERPVKKNSLLGLSMMTLLIFVGLLTILNFLAKKPESNPTQLPVNASSLTAPKSPTYMGTLPCADCPGIKTEIKLEKNGTFLMTEVYMERNDEKPITTDGKWTMVSNPNEKQNETTYKLISNNSQDAAQYYLLTKDDNLMLLDANMMKISAPGLNFTLKKQN